MLKTRSVLLLLTLIAPATLTAGTDLAESDALLARSIHHHDPDGRWGHVALTLSLDETRPNGPDRRTDVVIDPARELFEWRRQRGDDLLEGQLSPAGCALALNGSREISDEARERLRLDCDRLRLYRNYYTYLWGLPMKLRDPGTRLDPQVVETEFNGRPVLGIRVTYDPEVGSDIWHFYFDPDSAALVGYRFYHDEQANDGEYIVLEGEMSGAGFRLPASRTWYTHGDDRLLGTDTLSRIESPPSGDSDPFGKAHPE